MSKIEALKIIIAKSASQSAEAAKAIIAINKKSPAADMRCNLVAIYALEDTDANFTEDERAAIADLLSDEIAESRDYSLRVRLTASERVELARLADEAGTDVSSFVRKKIFE